MVNRTNITGNRIDYEIPSDLSESQKEIYRKAVRNFEDSIAIISELQQKRKNTEGDICEPPSRKTINTIAEINHDGLISPISVLKALRCFE